MTENTEEYWWKKYFDIAKDAAPDYAAYVQQLTKVIDKGEFPEENLKVVMANNLLPDRILEGLLTDKKCPEEFFEKAGEGLLVANKDYSSRFLQIVSKPDIPDSVLKNCCRTASKLAVKDVNQVVETLLDKQKMADAALTLVAEALTTGAEDKSEVLKTLLAHPKIPSRVLSNCTVFLPNIENQQLKASLVQTILKHPNYNADVAKSMIQNSCKKSDKSGVLTWKIDVPLWHDIMAATPSDKGLLTESIQLLSHMKDKAQVLDMCQTIVKNECCTQDVLKSLLHKMSYSEHFHDVCDILKQRSLLTHALKDKVAKLDAQYPIRLAREQQKQQLQQYISQPDKLPDTMSAADLQEMAQQISRYTGLELGFEAKTAAYEAIIKHPNCKAETYGYILQTVSTLGEAVLEEMRSGNVEAQQGWGIYKEFKQQRNEFRSLTDSPYDAEKMAALVQEAHQLVQNGSNEEIEVFKKRIFVSGEEALYKMDHNAVDWFIKNGTPENLEALNSLRGMYGLKTVVEDFSHADSDRTDAKRALFGGEISAVNQYFDAEKGEYNPHYFRKHSPTFLKFDQRDYMEQTFKAEDYHLESHAALQKMEEEGLKLPKEELAATFAEIHMPPALVNELNSTDLIHYFLEGRGVDIEKGQTYKLKEFDRSAQESVREQYWKKLADNEQFVDFISEDLWKKGVEKETIDRIWENCRNYGSPTKGENGKNNVFGISLQIHHCRALKDGGENKEDNFIVVVSTEKGSSVAISLNTHKPLHEYDNPCVALYTDENNKITREVTDRRIKILTFPSEQCANGERLAAYMGPATQNSCVLDKDGNLRTAVNDPRTVGKNGAAPSANRGVKVSKSDERE
ncbi:MAG: hypothetical protein J6Y53_05755 [Alphaproteobacteria bacterium]|nr:hypothetical protein [Alphaproteobacteria bacterium]